MRFKMEDFMQCASGTAERASSGAQNIRSMSGRHINKVTNFGD